MNIKKLLFIALFASFTVPHLYGAQAGPAKLMDVVQDDCPICMEKMEKEDITTLKCGNGKHIFHTECIKEAYEVNPKCPLCRAAINQEDITPIHYQIVNRILDISGQGLTSLEWLRNLSEEERLQLEHLNLSHNDLTSLPENTFQNFPALKSINLSENNLTSLPGNAFHNLPQLQDIFLYGNRIEIDDIAEELELKAHYCVYQ